MGMVYRGLDEALEREVAVKTLTGEGNLDEESRKRFEIEAKAAARLQHPNIVTVFELGEDRGVPFIAMEMLPGADLEALLRSGEALLLAEKLDVVIQVCAGPRLRPRAPDRPPRHQAQQHPPPRRRHREDHGLRHRQARRGPSSPRRA